MNYLPGIERVEQERTDRVQREGEYASGYCSCCGSDVGLDEDGLACGYCQAGRELLKEI